MVCIFSDPNYYGEGQSAAGGRDIISAFILFCLPNPCMYSSKSNFKSYLSILQNQFSLFVCGINFIVVMLVCGSLEDSKEEKMCHVCEMYREHGYR